MRSSRDWNKSRGDSRMRRVVPEKDKPDSSRESQESGEDVSETIENHMQTCFSWVFSSPHSRVEDTPEFLRLTSDVPHPMSNFVFRTRFPSQEVGAKIDEMIGFFKPRNLPVTWLVGPGCKPADIGQHLVSHGLTWEVDVGGMTIDLNGLNEDRAIPEDLTV